MRMQPRSTLPTHLQGIPHPAHYRVPALLFWPKIACRRVAIRALMARTGGAQLTFAAQQRSVDAVLREFGGQVQRVDIGNGDYKPVPRRVRVIHSDDRPRGAERAACGAAGDAELTRRPVFPVAHPRLGSGCQSIQRWFSTNASAC